MISFISISWQHSATFYSYQVIEGKINLWFYLWTFTYDTERGVLLESMKRTKGPNRALVWTIERVYRGMGVVSFSHWLSHGLLFHSVWLSLRPPLNRQRSKRLILGGGYCNLLLSSKIVICLLLVDVFCKILKEHWMK